MFVVSELSSIHIKYMQIKFERYKVRNKIVRLYKTWSRTKRRRSTTCRMSRTTNVYSYQRKFRTTPNGLRRYKLRCIARKFPWGFSRVFKDLSLLKKNKKNNPLYFPFISYGLKHVTNLERTYLVNIEVNHKDPNSFFMSDVVCII